MAPPPTRESGRSSDAFEADQRLKIGDSVLPYDGSWRAFATLRYHRKA